MRYNIIYLYNVPNILRDIFFSPDEAIRKEGRSQYETKNAQLLTNEVWHETPLSKFTKTSG